MVLHPHVLPECKLSPTNDNDKKSVAEAGVIMVKLATRKIWASFGDARNAVCYTSSLVDGSTTFLKGI